MRGRAAWLCMLLLLLCAARAEAAVCVVAPGVACLADASGEILLEGAEIEDVFAVREGALYAVGKKGAYRLYDADGKPLGETSFAMIDDGGDSLIFRVSSRFGAMDASGEVLLDPVWRQLTGDGAGGWLALDTDPLDETSDEILRVDANGEATPTGVTTTVGLSRLSDERMPFRDEDGRFGAIDARGDVAVPASWLALGAFEDGLSKVAGHDGVGMIDAQGREVVPAVYDWLERGEGFVAALGADGLDVFDRNGSLLWRLNGEWMEVAVAGAYVAVFVDDVTLVYGANGEEIFTCEGPAAIAPGAGGQLIVSGGEWGEACVRLIDPDGAAASPAFQSLLKLCEGRYAFLEMAGIEYYSPDLDRIQKSWDYDGARWGLMDAAGNVIRPARYTEIRPLGEERLLLIADGEVVMSDLDGRAIRTWLTAEIEEPTSEAAS